MEKFYFFGLIFLKASLDWTLLQCCCATHQRLSVKEVWCRADHKSRHWSCNSKPCKAPPQGRWNIFDCHGCWWSWSSWHTLISSIEEQTSAHKCWLLQTTSTQLLSTENIQLKYLNQYYEETWRCTDLIVWKMAVSSSLDLMNNIFWMMTVQKKFLHCTGGGCWRMILVHCSNHWTRSRRTRRSCHSWSGHSDQASKNNLTGMMRLVWNTVASSLHLSPLWWMTSVDNHCWQSPVSTPPSPSSPCWLSPGDHLWR